MPKFPQAWLHRHCAAASDSKPTPPAGPSPTHPAQRTGGAMPKMLQSAHGKMIPVVPSHAYLAAQKKAAMMGNVAGDPLTSKSYILVGKREESGKIKVVATWPHLPTQAEVEAAAKGTQYKYVTFALTSPVNVF